MSNHTSFITPARTALIIDDEEGLRLTSRAFFEKRGFTVLEAENGAHGIGALMATKSIEVVTLDLMMPEVDGFSFLATIDALKKSGALKKVPKIIVLTVVNSYAELKRLSNFECVHAVLKKPFNPEELEHQIELQK